MDPSIVKETVVVILQKLVVALIQHDAIASSFLSAPTVPAELGEAVVSGNVESDGTMTDVELAGSRAATVTVYQGVDNTDGGSPLSVLDLGTLRRAAEVLPHVRRMFGMT